MLDPGSETQCPPESPVTASLHKTTEQVPAQGSTSAGAIGPWWVRGWQPRSSSTGPAAAETLSGFLSARLSRLPHQCGRLCWHRARCTTPQLAKQPGSLELLPSTAPQGVLELQPAGKSAWKPLQRDAAVNTSSNYQQDFLLFPSTPLPVPPSAAVVLAESWCQGTEVHHLTIQDVTSANRRLHKSYSAHLVARTS